MMGNKKAVKPVLILGVLVALSKALAADYRLPGAPSIPKFLILGLLSLGMATLAPAAQRGGGAPAVLPPAMHALPAAPVAGGHAAPMHAPSAAHLGTHPVAPEMTPVLPHESAVHTGHSQAFHHDNAGRTIRNNFCSGQPLINLGNNPVPGFGFDYEHFYAVHPTWNTCNHVSADIVPYYGGGGYDPGPYYSAPGNQEAADENASNEQPESRRITYAQEPAASASSRSDSNSYSYTPTEPVVEFVFVKRDGSTFYAAAYIVLKDKVQYVTREGLCRSITLDSLDPDATHKFNEERGNTVDLPGLAHPS
jgi:hypothetical protein